MRTYSMKDLPKVQQQWISGNVAAGVRGMRSAAQRAAAFYVQRIDQERAVDTGRMKSSFQVVPTEKGAVLSNAATYFSVMDQGRRPGAPGPPLRPILEWVLRKRLTGSSRAATGRSGSLTKQATSIAWAIRNKIHRLGIRPRHIASGAAQIQQVLQFLVDEVTREARKPRP